VFNAAARLLAVTLVAVAVGHAADIFTSCSSAETGFLRPTAVLVCSALDRLAFVFNADAFAILAAVDSVARRSANAFRLITFVETFVT